ncbi:MAG: response regulator [Bacteroidota bacterium]|nr:response regulator [Bacteroidota bacterium]MDP4196954.1 response regulator [Bacteroidota bacterium]
MENLKILVIDDTEFLRIAMKKFFENYDFAVTTCNSGLEGIKYAARIAPDIIFLDLMMPNFNGIDVIKSLRVIESCRNAPIVLITAHKNNTLIEEARTLGITKVLFKPLKRRDVFEVMDELLGGQALSKQKLERLFEKEKETDDVDIPDHDVELKGKLLKHFLKSADLVIRDIRSAIGVNNPFMLKSIVHDLRGQGSAIGYSRLTMLSEYVEGLIDKKGSLEWKEIQDFSNKIIDVIDIIKDENKDQV